MPKTTSLSVLVPVYNEEYLVETSLRRLFVLEESPYLERIQIIVVNDGSNDGSLSILERLSDELPSKSYKITWIFKTHAINQGKGKAIQTALRAADCEIAIIHDADLEYDPKDILRIIPLFLHEDADAVYGSRFLVDKYRRVLFFRHELGNKLLTFFCNLLTDLNLTDMETCYKAVRTGLLKSIPIQSNDFRLEPEITIKLAKRRARIFEVPINYSGRTYQEGKKINWKDGFRALWAMFRFGMSHDIFIEDRVGGKILMEISESRHINAWIVSIISPYIGQNILEVGAGIGNLTRQLLPRQQYYATDINAAYLHILQRLQVDKPYLHVALLDVTNITSFQSRGQFDTVICSNVLEHLEDDKQAFRNIADLLAPHGKAVVIVPQGEWLLGSLDAVLGHKRRYSITQIQQLAQQTGLMIQNIIPFNRISSFPWFVNGNIFKRRKFGRFQLFIVNLLIPLMKRIDRFLPFPPLSLIVILEKQ